MTQQTKLDGLAALSELRFQAVQTELAELLSREAALRQNLRQLINSKESQARAPRHAGEAALVAGADMRWHRWVDQRRAVINQELAQVMVLKENCRARLKDAFGRRQAANALISNHIQAQRVRQRRADYES